MLNSRCIMSSFRIFILALCFVKSEAIKCFNCYGSNGACYGRSMINCSPLTTFCRLEITRTHISQSCARDVHCTPESFLSLGFWGYQDPAKRNLLCCSTDGCNCFGQRQCAGLKPFAEPLPRNKTFNSVSNILRCFSCQGNAGQCLGSKMIRCPRESSYCKLESSAATGVVKQTCARRVHCRSGSFRELAFDLAKDINVCCKTPGCNCIGGQCSQLERK